MNDKVPRRVLIVSPDAFLPRYNMFPDFVIGKKLADEGTLQVFFATRKTAGTRMFGSYEGVRTYRLPGLFYRNNRLWSLCRSFFAALLLLLLVRPDLLFVNHFRSGCFPLVFLARLFGCRTVQSEAGILHDDYITDDRDNPLRAPVKVDNIIWRLGAVGGGRGAKKRLFNYFRHWPWYHVDRLVFYSRHNLDYARLIGLDERKIKTVRHFFNARYLERSTAAIEQYRLPGKKVVFLICQLKLRKGYDLFLEAAKRVAGSREDVVFILASSSPDKARREAIREFVEVNNLDGKLLFLTSISNEVRNYLYERADVYLMPSRYEGFGLPAIEAGHSGCVVVASDVPALNEFLEDGTNALLFAVDDLDDLYRQVLAALDLNADEKAKLAAGMARSSEWFDIGRLENFTREFLELVQ